MCSKEEVEVPLGDCPFQVPLQEPHTLFDMSDFTLDDFLISSLASKVSKCIIGDCLRSDHAIVTIQILTTEHPREHGYWKLNLSLLNYPKFVEKTKEFITEFFENNENSSDPHNIWEAFKCEFRGHGIKMGSWKQKHFLIKERSLIEEN